MITEIAYADQQCTQPTGDVGLCVLNPTGLFFHSLANGGSTHDADEGGTGGYAPGSWHWPERV